MSGDCQRHARYQQDDPNQSIATRAACHRGQAGGWMAREARGASGSCRDQWRGDEGNDRSTERGGVEGPDQATEII